MRIMSTLSLLAFLPGLALAESREEAVAAFAENALREGATISFADPAPGLPQDAARWFASPDAFADFSAIVVESGSWHHAQDTHSVIYLEPSSAEVLGQELAPGGGVAWTVRVTGDRVSASSDQTRREPVVMRVKIIERPSGDAPDLGLQAVHMTRA